MTSTRKARILGTGSYLPKRVLSNGDLETMVDTADEWIRSRTGISERRIAAREECTSHMGTKAAREALSAAKRDPSDIDLILVATMTPDFPSPGSAPLIQQQLKAGRAAAMDLQAACTGYLYGLSVAKAYVESGLYKTVLLVASEKMSAFIDYTDRNTCVLFGDGASAAVIGNASQGEGFDIGPICLGADGSLAELITIPGGGARYPASVETLTTKQHYFKMAGKEVFKHAVRHMASAARECLDAAKIPHAQLKWLVPHQANKRIVESLATGLEVPLERIFLNLHKYGNTCAASVGIALDELVDMDGLEIGDHVLLVAVGGGLTWGAAVLTYQSTHEESL